ncbi:hypothetical protein [Nannocystis sp.]|uniref:hypothetical protein n=1 Tax=Nannocystis sp. TaxID=1962667 RepID=UPI0024218603|nr:hypothetical protein [Nannocystis sp.]MBK7828899.1 hypothetical protein [Nannocystis sp.]MBK9756608.1 hypothetical protein [Nannocystis sp.]
MIAAHARARGRSVGCLALLGLALGLACHISNEDHCVHKAIESDAWCAAQSPARPFCSPCEAQGHGCVAVAPDPEVCPAYSPDGDTDSTSTGDTDTSTSA